MKPFALIVPLIVLLAGCRSSNPERDHPLPPDHAPQVDHWRAKHEVDYRRDWASIAGRLPRKEGATAAGSRAPKDSRLAASMPGSVGRFDLTGGDVRFQRAAGVDVRLQGQPVTAPIVLQDDKA